MDESRAKKPRVLVIDDERFIVALVRRILAGEYEVEGTTSAREALGWIRDGRTYDLILCDLTMPDLSGMELYEAVANDAPALLGRIAFLSGGAVTSDARAFFDKLAGRTLAKPFDAPVLRAAVRVWVAG